MAPEVLTGKSEVDERIDVYGLGVLLYEALSGARAFRRHRHVGRLLMKIDAGDCLPLDAVADVPSLRWLTGGRPCDASRSKSERHASASRIPEAAWRAARRSS